MSLDWLLVFVPVILAPEAGNSPAPLVFFATALAVVPVTGPDTRHAARGSMRWR
ncbi:MAG: hypothetical protein IT486_06530 [Gammaproteobacteria bacterium]|nr:hypothetical protein [Gammaproteobacteria bacterium]